MARGRGGQRTPRNPAPVSGPGALARRTDGGPSDRGQPIRVAQGGAYGSRQALENLQSAAPLAAGGAPPSASPSGPATAAGGGAPPAMFTPLDAAPQSRFAQPPRPPRIFQDNKVDDMLRMMYQLTGGHPDILRLLPTDGT